MCRVPQEPPVTVCEIGSGFLCVNTPPGGVAKDSARIEGTIDRRGSVLAGIRIAVQNEYTKRISYVDTASPAGSDCWNSQDKSYCLDPQGFFSAGVSLQEFGPYTISITASRLSGESVTRRVRLSRVKPIELGEGDVAFTPDVRTSSETHEAMVTVTVKLLGDCSFCDFIGASTGGVSVSVENAIEDLSGARRRIGCATTVEQGGAGQFVIGVPVHPGRNSLAVRACNAAHDAGACPEVSGISFMGTGSVASFGIISPPPAPSYDSDEYPTIPLEFSLGDWGECATLRFNREAPREVCPVSGKFAAELLPQTGINVVGISREGAADFAWTFGWGRITSPFGEPGGRIAVPNAVGIALPSKTVRNILLPLANNFLSSDEFKKLLAREGDNDPSRGDGEDANEDGIVGLIPGCGEGGGLEGLMMKLRGEPRIGNAEVEDLEFGDSRIDLRIDLESVGVGIDLVPDEDGDGRGDRGPLPLVVAFRRALVDVALEVGEAHDGSEILLVTSPHSDCDYKRGSYCEGRPAPLVPENFVGGADSLGGFVRCDEEIASDEAFEACRAINSLDAQTGVVAEKVLDAINDILYCGGSRALTRLVRGGVDMPTVRLGCRGDAGCEGFMNLLPPVMLPWGFGIEEGIDISPRGLVARARLSVGDQELYENTPPDARVPSAGLVTGGGAGAKAISLNMAQGRDVAAAVSLDAVNAFLFSAAAQGNGRDVRGLFDFDLHELFFEKSGFDFVAECDAFEPIPGERENLPALCHIRPRVGELLGSPLSTYGYFSQKQPIMLAVRGNRALGPMLRIATPDELPVVAEADDANVPTGALIDVQLGGIELAFYALEVDGDQPPDEYGNVRLKLDGGGNPIIRSMQPDDPDPWNGPIVAFDASLLLGAEVGRVKPDPKDDSRFVIELGVLADRSRLVIAPIAGSNSTTVPERGLISALDEKLRLALAGFSSSGKPVQIPVPRNIALRSNSGDEDASGQFGLLGLKTMTIGEEGLGMDFDAQENLITIAIQAALTQVLHRGGEEVEYTIPAE